MNYTWTGTATCQYCGKTAALGMGEVSYSDRDRHSGQVQFYFVKPEGWHDLDFCSRRCSMQADLAQVEQARDRLMQEIERENQSGESQEDHGESS